MQPQQEGWRRDWGTTNLLTEHSREQGDFRALGDWLCLPCRYIQGSAKVGLLLGQNRKRSASLKPISTRSSDACSLAWLGRNPGLWRVQPGVWTEVGAGPHGYGAARNKQTASVPSPGLFPAGSRMSVFLLHCCLNTVWCDVRGTTRTGGSLGSVPRSALFLPYQTLWFLSVPVKPQV